MKELEKKIEKFANLIIEANDVIALTGAGMSTESGIPDFRSPGTGLWEKMDPSFTDISSFTRDPSSFYKVMLELGLDMMKAKPHAGHKALTRLQKMGKLNGIITQNIDGLHLRARTKNIAEMHGNIREAICMKCKKIHPITELINQAMSGNYAPGCSECSGILKPNAVFFGEMLPEEALQLADNLIAKCDLMLILGSTLLVAPVMYMPYKALGVDAKLAIINIQETHMDRQCLVVIHDSIKDILPKIVDLVEKKI